MESQQKCNKCSNLFYLYNPPYELPCQPNLCSICLEKAFDSSKINITCPIEQKLFNININIIILHKKVNKLNMKPSSVSYKLCIMIVIQHDSTTSNIHFI